MRVVPGTKHNDDKRRRTLRKTPAKLRERTLERKHRAGYKRHPVKRAEFAAWEREQAWGEP